MVVASDHKLRNNYPSFLVVGLLYDATAYYPSSFYFGGAVTILGALVMIPAAIKEQKGKL